MNLQQQCIAKIKLTGKKGIVMDEFGDDLLKALAIKFGIKTSRN